ncbi:EF-hand domain-containing protein [Sinorhizobium fredii]|uniref:EF-hand domain-containing protein n=1 Tax=Rhizobium fredii TaxID=380 RepID=UPI00351225A3
MRMTVWVRPVALTALFAILATGSAAQTTAVDPHHPNGTTTQAAPPSGAEGTAGDGGQSGHRGMMPGGMMGQGMMGPGMTMGRGMTGEMSMMPMRGLVMKIMFAIADANGDGSLSFEEVSVIHKRIFDRVDANKDGNVFPEEVQAFVRP